MRCELCKLGTETVDSYLMGRELQLSCFKLMLCKRHWEELDKALEQSDVYLGWTGSLHLKRYWELAVSSGRTDSVARDAYMNACSDEHTAQMELRAWARLWLADHNENNS